MHLVNVLTDPRVPSLTDLIMFGQVFFGALRAQTLVSFSQASRAPALGLLGV